MPEKRLPLNRGCRIHELQTDCGTCCLLDNPQQNNCALSDTLFRIVSLPNCKSGHSTNHTYDTHANLHTRHQYTCTAPQHWHSHHWRHTHIHSTTTPAQPPPVTCPHGTMAPTTPPALSNMLLSTHRWPTCWTTTLTLSPAYAHPSVPTLHRWCRAFLLCDHTRYSLPNHTLCLMRPLTYTVDLFPNIYNPDSYFLPFVPTSVQRRYNYLFYFQLVVTYCATKITWSCHTCPPQCRLSNQAAFQQNSDVHSGNVECM
jgi:hypothetical protein